MRSLLYCVPAPLNAALVAQGGIVEELSGGRESAIYRDGEVVYRPLQPWSSTIHLILKHLERAKVDEIPRFLGVNQNQEILSFVAGNTLQLSGSWRNRNK